MATHSSTLENSMGGGAWQAAVHGVTKSRTRLSDFTFTFHFHALEKEMATHSSVLAWRIPGTGWAAVYGVVQSRTQLKRLSSSSSSSSCQMESLELRTVQFSSVAQWSPTLCDPMNHSTPGLPVNHQLLESTQTYVHQVGDIISSSVIPFSSCPQSFPASGSFQMSQLFSSYGQSIGVSASTSVPPMNTQD